ncbi:MAG: EamA family transporter [Pseudomonadota bacterium]
MYEIWLVTLCWGLSFPLARILVGEMNPLWITFFRFFLGGGTLFIYAVFRTSWADFKKQPWSLILFLAVFEFFLMYFLYLSSLKYLPASKVAALTLTTPAIILLFDSFFRKRLPGIKIIFPVILAVLGALALYNRNVASNFNPYAQLFGFALILGSNACFAFANVIMRPKLQASSLPVISLAQLLAAFMSGLASLSLVGLPGKLSLTNWGILFYLSVVATGLGFWFWNRSINKLGALYPSLISNLKAPIAAIFSMIILSELVPFIMWLGMTFLILSAGLAHTTIEKVKQ